MAGIFSTIFQCTPIKFAWDKSIEGGHCASATAEFFSNAAINMITDFGILLSPMPPIWKLQMDRQRKVGITLVFATGFFVCIISVLRIRTLYKISTSTDATWDNVAAANWSCVEANLAIICSCMPSFMPFLKILFPRFTASLFKLRQFSRERSQNLDHHKYTSNHQRPERLETESNKVLEESQLSSVTVGRERSPCQTERSESE